MYHRHLALLAAVSLSSAATARADLVTDWNLIAVQTANTLSSASNQAPRALAITHIAIHNALQAVDKTYASYPTGVELQVDQPVSREAAILGAAWYSLSALVPNKKAELTTKLAAALNALPDGPEKRAGRDLGVAAASAIVDLRGPDGAILVEAPYLGSTDVGKWRPTGVDAAALAVPGADPHWRTLVPFAIETPLVFRAAVPPAVNSPAYLKDLEEVRKLGAAQSTTETTLTRTGNQSEIAKFWEFGTHNPINAIARQIAKREQLSLAENARLFAQLNIALADSRVAVWDSKYFYSCWRPVTAIVTGDGVIDDGSNVDAEWAPFLSTPAHPEYPSGHSTTGAAGVAVLKGWFGDEVEVTVSSDSLPEVTRSFTSLGQVALENGRSRIYGGIHFQYANAAGLTLGQKVGEHVLKTQLPLLPEIEPELDAGAGDAGLLDDAGLGVDAGAGSDAGALVDAGGPVDAGATVDASAPDAGEPVVDAAVPTPDTDAGAIAHSDAGAPPLPGADAGADADDDDDDGCSVGFAGQRRAGALPLLMALGLLGLRRRRTLRARA